MRTHACQRLSRSIARTPAASTSRSRTTGSSRCAGSRANPYTAGVICAKVARDFPRDRQRGGTPAHAARAGVGGKGEGRFERISWEEALDVIHARFTAVIAAHGPQAILPLNYAGPHGMLAGGSMDLRFFHKLGATVLDRKPLCGGIRSEAWLGTFGPVPGIPPEQVALSKLIVAWGNNVTWSNLHLMPVINAARRHGGKLVVVDPKRTKVAEQADLHLALRPGTDVVLAWAMTNELERLGGLDRAFIEQHVQGFESYMERVRAGHPGRRRAHHRRAAGRDPGAGRLVPRALAGRDQRRQRPRAESERRQRHPRHLRAAGPGGEARRAGRRTRQRRESRVPQDGGAARSGRTWLPPGTRTLNIVDVGAHLLDPALAPPIKAVFIYNHNPVIVHPDQNRLRRGLLREDLFTVGSDVVMTDSMAYCDIVLPASSHFEYDDLYPAYGQHWLQRAEAVIRPRGESLPNTEIFRRLAARFGFDDPIFTASDARLMDDAMDAERPSAGRRVAEPASHRPGPRDDVNGEPAVLFKNVFPRTPSGKIELASTYLEEKYGQRLPGHRPYETAYPLLLISPASDQRITSTFGGLKAERSRGSARDAPRGRDGARSPRRGEGQGVERPWRDSPPRSRSRTP